MHLMAVVTAGNFPFLLCPAPIPPLPTLPVPLAAVQVQGLEALGFPRDACVEARMACTFQLSQL